MNAEQTNHHVEPGCPNDEYLSRLLAEGVEDYAVYVAAPSGHISTWKTGATRQKGYAREEASSRSFSTFYLPENQRAGKPQALAALAANGRAGDEWRRHRRYGSHSGTHIAFAALDKGGTSLFGGR